MNYLENILLGADLDALPFAVQDGPDLPGKGRVSGTIKEQPEDFMVEEIQGYPFAGTGDHLMMLIEKTDIAGGDMLRHVSMILGVSDRDIGTAGTKDRRAVTRQWVAVPASCEPRVQGLNEVPGLKVIETIRHTNKLKTGHLKGNRFTILVRNADVSLLPELKKAVEIIAVKGFPNLFGSQRFGRNMDTLILGLDLLGLDLGQQGRRGRRIGGFEKRMAISAVQSALFNVWVKERYAAGLERTILKGDVLAKTVTGGMFTCDDPETDQQRFDNGEVEITGPMFGNKMMAATDVAGEREKAVLDSVGFNDRSFAPAGKLAEGTRRSMNVVPEGLSVEAAENGVVFCFFLPKGCYASVLMREFVLDTRGIS